MEWNGSLLRVTKLGIGLGLGSINQSIHVPTDRSPILHVSFYSSFFSGNVLLLLLLLLLLSSMCPIVPSMYSCHCCLRLCFLPWMSVFFVCTCTYLLSDLQVQFLFD
jgi:hypothetical protein